MHGWGEMDLKQMAIFREVILTGSVSEAARNLNRTQPSVSHAISRLEDELGIQLFERRRGRLHPVPEAHYLFRECDQVLTRVKSVRQTMKRMKSLESGELRVVSMPGPAAVLLPRLISDHVGAHPDVKATLLSRSSDAVVQLIGAQQFDIGIADHDPNRNLEQTSIHAKTYQFHCLCALPANNPLAGLSKITPQELSGQPIATLFPEHRTAQVTRRVFDQCGSILNIRFVGQFFLPLLTYVQVGYAIALVDPLIAQSWKLSSPDPDSVVFRPFEPVVEFEVDVLRPAYRPESLLAKSFAERLEARISANSKLIRSQ